MLLFRNRSRHKKSPKHTYYAHIAFLTTTILWAAAGPVIKLTVQEIPPATFLFLRFLIVGIVLLPYMIIQLGKNPVHKADYINFFLLGLFSQTAIIGAFWGLKLTSVLDYTIISLSGALLAIYAGHYFFKEKINDKVVLGLVIATVGTLIVILEPLISSNGSHTPIVHRLIGNLIALLFNLTWVTYVVWSKMTMGEKSPILSRTLKFLHLKPMRRNYSPTLIVAITFYVGLATVIPIALLEKVGFFGPYTFDILATTTSSIIGLLYMAIFSSIVAYMSYQWGLENAHVSDGALYGYLTPIFTLPFAYILLGEIPNTVMIISGMLIAVGVLIAEKENT